ncbi:MAG: ABC transporter ATP-binding protein [Clostridia bacterium]|nr:ABC transporter ATP-binding protein [Clostridia bacterium]
MSVLECKGLKKAYKKGKYVLDDFNLTVEGGKIVGLLGPNGCGKSTLMKLISGLLVADGGEIAVCGEPVGDKSKALVSFLPERLCFNPQQKVSELLDFFTEFYEDFDLERATKLLEILEIDKNARLKALSKGTKEKVQLILVMSRRAKLYLLDEPIAGVDPAAREYILSTIVDNYSKDSTIIITTHLISDVEQVLDDYVFLSQDGKILEEGSVDDVRAESGMSLDARFKEVFRYAK